MDDIAIQLEKAMATENPKGELAHVLAQMHQRWLSYSWEHYSKEAHATLAEMYLDDERFTAYYDDKVKKRELHNSYMKASFLFDELTKLNDDEIAV